MFKRIKDFFSNFSFFLKVFTREFSLARYAKTVGFYTNLDIIPIYNFYQLFDGKLEYLYKKKRIKKYPEYFKTVFVELFYQMEKVDMYMIEKQHKLQYLYSLYLTTKRSDFLNKARSLAHEIKKEKEHEKVNESLNESVNFIEMNNNSIGAIDVHKIAASRFYSLYYATIEKLKSGNTQSN